MTKMRGMGTKANPYKFYLKAGETYYQYKKELKFISIKNPEVVFDFTNLNPDEVEEFKEIGFSPHSEDKPEKLFNIIADIKTVGYLAEKSFDGVYNQIKKYLLEKEDYERLILLNDIQHLHKDLRNKRNKEIKDFINQHNK